MIHCLVHQNVQINTTTWRCPAGMIIAYSGNGLIRAFWRRRLTSADASSGHRLVRGGTLAVASGADGSSYTRGGSGDRGSGAGCSESNGNGDDGGHGGYDSVDGSGNADGSFLNEFRRTDTHSEGADGSSGALDSGLAGGSGEGLQIRRRLKRGRRDKYLGDQTAGDDWGRGDGDGGDWGTSNDGAVDNSGLGTLAGSSDAAEPLYGQGGGGDLRGSWKTGRGTSDGLLGDEGSWSGHWRRGNIRGSTVESGWKADRGLADRRGSTAHTWSAGRVQWGS